MICYSVCVFFSIQFLLFLFFLFLSLCPSLLFLFYFFVGSFFFFEYYLYVISTVPRSLYAEANNADYMYSKRYSSVLSLSIYMKMIVLGTILAWFSAATAIVTTALACSTLRVKCIYDTNQWTFCFTFSSFFFISYRWWWCCCCCRFFLLIVCFSVPFHYYLRAILVRAFSIVNSLGCAL